MHMGAYDRHLLWYRSNTGIGDRIHHIVQMLEIAEQEQAHCIVDFRDGMFGELGEDAFSRWLTCPHPLFVQAPDFEAILDTYQADQIPSQLTHFAPHPYTDYPFRIQYPSERITRALNTTYRHNALSGRLLRKINMVFRPKWVIDRVHRTPIASMGYRIPWRKLERPTLLLYMDVIRKPRWSRTRIVWPRPDVISSIEAEWPSMGLNPADCAALHVRQTDKSTSTQWRKWLDEIKQGKRFGDRSQLFLATDSKQVLDAFKQAGLQQTVLHNPWLTLSDNESPLHLSNHDGAWVMRTALFDLWTCASCANFQPWKFSSFSRLISAWRAFR